MKPEEEKFLTDNRTDIMKNIIWGVLLESHLKTIGAVNDEELQDISCQQTPLKKSAKFLDTMILKENGFQVLKEILEKTNQTGASAILRKFQPTLQNSTDNTSGASQQSSASHTTPFVQSTQQQTGNVWKVDFGDKDVKHEVLQKIQSDLIAKMDEENLNAKIILELASLNLFDRCTLDPLLNNTFSSQQQRMNRLFQRVAGLEPEEILSFLEKLCNLSEYPVASKRFQSVLNKHYAGCVRKH